MVIGIDIDNTIDETAENVAHYLKIYASNFTGTYRDLPPKMLEEFLL